MKIHGAKPRSEPEVIAARLAQLAEAFQLTVDEMHRLDGTQPNSEFGGSEMQTAHHFINTAWLWAKQAVEEN